MNFGIELFIASIDHVLIIYNIRIHWELFIEFSCNFYEILCCKTT